jgi:phospholipid/cholesterol/gamma-HCH transport system ATP-binding protein
MVTHDLESLYAVCDRIAVLADGKIVVTGPIEAMLQSQHPWVKQYFNGQRAGAIQRRQGQDSIGVR